MPGEFSDIPDSSVSSSQDAGGTQEVVDAVNSGFSSMHLDNAALLEEVDSLGSNVALLVDARSGAGGSDLDYTGQLDGIGQNLALANTLLLVTVVVLFLSAGLMFGNALTRWLRER